MTTRIPTQEEYERSEYQKMFTKIQQIEKAPLPERKDAAKEFGVALHDPNLIAERVGWLLEGDYGFAEMKRAQKSAETCRNKAAALGQLIAIFEWMCPARMAAAEWRMLTPTEQDAINTAILNSYHDWLMSKELASHD